MEVFKIYFDECLGKLRASLKDKDYILNEEVFEKVKQLFFSCKENPQILREKTKEFTKIEKQKEKREGYGILPKCR